MPKSPCLTRDHALHDSRDEARDCNRLLSMLQAGQIKSYRTQRPLPILFEGRTIYWKVDFEVETLSGEIVYHETKGVNPSDQNFLYKVRLFKLQNPDKKVFVNWKILNVNKALQVKCDGIIRMKKKTEQRARLWRKTKSAIYHRTYDRKTKRWITVKTPTSTG